MHGFETLSIDRVLNKEHFYGKIHAENLHQIQVTFLILENSLK